MSKRDFLLRAAAASRPWPLKASCASACACREARIERIRITSTRPDVARSLLQGRSRAEVARRGAAAVLDLRPFAGSGQRAGLRRRRRRGRERRALRALPRFGVAPRWCAKYAWRTLLDWPHGSTRRRRTKPSRPRAARSRCTHDAAAGAPAKWPHSAIALAAFGVPRRGLAGARLAGRLRPLGRRGAAPPPHASSAGAGRWPRPPQSNVALADVPRARRPAITPRWIGEIAQAADADPSIRAPPHLARRPGRDRRPGTAARRPAGRPR